MEETGMKLLKALVLVGLVGALGAFTTGCGNACDDAVDHINECGGTNAQSNGGDCSGAAECVAGCINDASCDSLTGKDIKGAATYSKCVISCGT
jgi:hypothetical protein